MDGVLHRKKRGLLSTCVCLCAWFTCTCMEGVLHKGEARLSTCVHTCGCVCECVCARVLALGLDELGTHRLFSRKS